jgi:NADPH:quinone reductase-like Zn-dependent oxidoreductase
MLSYRYVTHKVVHRSGYRPITTCSPHNNALVQSFGAEKVFDYHSPTCAQEIKTYTGNKLRHVLDIITDSTSQEICYASFGRLGGKYTCLELPSESLHTRKTVKKEMIVGLAASGKEIALAEGYEREANPENRRFAAEWFQMVQRLLDEGKFKSHPPKVLAGGFEAILDGLVILKRKGTSGEKLVVFIDPEEEKKALDTAS